MKSQIATDNFVAMRTLVQVIESGSLTDAGRRLGLTPSAVSRQVSRLEEDLGVRLLERTTRRVRATDAGLELFQRTRPLFESFAEAGAAVRARREELRGRVRLSVAPALGRTRVLPALARLAQQHPGLDFDVVLTGTRLDFFEEELDLAVREGELEDSSLIARRLGTGSVWLCAAPQYLKRRGQLRSIEDLAGHDLLLLPSAENLRGLSPLIEKLQSATKSGRSRLTARFRVNDLFALKELAEAGSGIAALPDYVADPAIAAGTLKRLLPRTAIAEIAVHALLPSRRHLPRRVEIVLDALAAAFAGK